MKRKMLAVLFTFTMTASLLVGCASGDEVPTDASASVDNSKSDSSEAQKEEEDEKKEEENAGVSADEGKVLNIYCWNDEFQGLFEKYYKKAGLIPDGVKVNFIITPNENNAYQNALDEALLNQESASADEKIDMFLVEADYALKYVNSDYSLDVKKDVGLTDEDMSQQYQYTKDIVTDSDGVQKGTTWQATPGLFAYRRSIAKDVLGTDDPAAVQEALADWGKFDEVAAKAHEKGYKMLSGYEDSYRTFSNNMAGPWVDGNKIVVDDNLMKWVDQTKEFTDKGYNNKTALWAPEWQADQGPDGKVFGFFYSTWGINFTLMGNSLATSEDDGGKLEVGNGSFGDWAVCQGPESYFWGGSWLCATAGSDNLGTVQSIMKTMTCDQATMKKITKDTQDYTNNEAAMNELANSDFQSAFLGGQNHIKLFAEVAPKIDMSNCSPYDQGLNESLQGAFRDYYDGTVDKDKALENFYASAIEKYPELTK